MALPDIHPDSLEPCQVLQNLIINACEFGMGKPVRVRAAVQPVSGGESSLQEGARPSHNLVLVVADQGCGLSDAAKKSVFEQWEASSPATGGGSGLGVRVPARFDPFACR